MINNIPPEKFLRITREKFQKMVKEARPLTCWFNITEACDLKCKFCFANSHSALENELSTKEILGMIDNISEAGTNAMVFGGGEPTLRKDLLRVANYAANRHDMFIALNTHGQSLIDKHYVSALASVGFSQIKVSVDGLEKTHDWNRGAGTFKKCIQALENCVRVGFPSIWLLATISKLNYGEVADILKLGIDLGVQVGMVQLLPLGRGQDYKDLMLTEEQTREWQRLLFEQKELYGHDRVLFEDRYQICEDGCSLCAAIDPDRIGTFIDTPSGCVTGIWQYLIGADAKVYVGDVMVPETEIGSLRQEKLSEIWEKSELVKLLKDRDKLKGKCGRCELRFVCGGCRRMVFGLTGDIMGPDPKCWYKPCL